MLDTPNQTVDDQFELGLLDGDQILEAVLDSRLQKFEEIQSVVWETLKIVGDHR